MLAEWQKIIVLRLWRNLLEIWSLELVRNLPPRELKLPLMSSVATTCRQMTLGSFWTSGAGPTTLACDGAGCSGSFCAASASSCTPWQEAACAARASQSTLEPRRKGFFLCCVFPVVCPQMFTSCQLAKQEVLKGSFCFSWSRWCRMHLNPADSKLVTGTAFVSIFYCLKNLRPNYWL